MNRWWNLHRGSGSLAAKSELEVTSSYRMPVRLEATWQFTQSRGVLGATVAVHAELVLSAVEGWMSLGMRSATERPAEGTSWRICVVPLGARIARDDRRACSLPANRRLSLCVTDDDGRPLTTDSTVSSGDSGTHHADWSFSTPVDTFAWISPGHAPGTARPRLQVSGELVFSRGVSLQLSPGSEPGANRLPVRVRLVGPGTSLRARERTLEEGCPAEAWVTAGFVDEWGHELSDRSLLGRYALP